MRVTFLYHGLAGLVQESRPGGNEMLIGAFVLFLVLWVLGFVVFHVASWAIHLLLVIGLISLVMHFFRRGRTVA